jgi:hypothetical protein
MGPAVTPERQAYVESIPVGVLLEGLIRQMDLAIERDTGAEIILVNDEMVVGHTSREMVMDFRGKYGPPPPPPP